MFKFFDYLFYKACEFYKKKEGGEGYRLGALLIIVVLQGFNVATIFLAAQVIAHAKIKVSTFQVIIYVVFFLVANGIKYNNSKYDLDELRKRWGHEDERVRKKKQNIIIIYMVLSTALVFGLSIYLGSKKW